MTDIVRDLLKRVDVARDSATTTCPASRHTMMIGEHLALKGAYPMLQEEPRHCGGSLLATVASLWEARTALSSRDREIERLRELLGQIRVSQDPIEMVGLAALADEQKGDQG